MKMTVKQTLEQFLLAWNSNAYLNMCTSEDMKNAIQALEEVEQYRALGTVEELKEAREKQVAKKPKSEQYFYGVLDRCPVCEGRLYYEQKYCDECGQALKWGEEDEQG